MQSAFFNVNQTLVDLYDLLIKDINKPGHEGNLGKESIWKKLSLNQPYDDIRFRKFCSDLLKLVEDYLALVVYQENILLQTTLLIEAVGEKKLEKLYNSVMKDARRISEQAKLKDADFYLKQYQIEKNYYNLTKYETKRTSKSNVEDIAKNIDSFYFSEKLRIACEVLSRQNLASYDYKISLIDEIVKHVNSPEFESVPSVMVYYQIYLLYTELENEDHYHRLIELLDKYSIYFPEEAVKDELYMSAQNYCIRKINQGNQNFLKELFFLYQTLIKKEIIIANGEISPWYFRNIVVVALRLGEYTWTEDFIIKYQDFLEEDFRRNTVTYNLAQLYFYQKTYGKVIEQLRNVEYEDVTYNLNSKAMLLATYYELDELEPLYSLIDSFSAYLNRHKDIASDKRKDYFNLIKFTKKLLKVNPSDKKALEVLKQEVQATKRLASPNWLLEKIAELE
ncbi:MAG: hypothetical protein HUU01_02965 [Saprospiraceae bacterium]|nr:hypothetical protein [Saprospiraceae bacterium]